MTSLLMKEIHNLQEVIDDCLDDIPIDDGRDSYENCVFKDDEGE